MLRRYQKAAQYRLYQEYKQGPFTTSQAAETLNKSPESAKKLMYELKSACALVKLGWGTYMLVQPTKYVGVESLLYSFKKEQEAFFQVLGPLVNDIEVLVLHGSRARGEASKGSDIDIAIGVPSRCMNEIYQCVKENKSRLPSRLSIECFPVDGFSDLPFKNAIVFYLACKEGMPSYGELVCRKIAKHRFRKEELLEALDESLSFLRIGKELVELPDTTKSTLRTAVYSATLRLRLAFDVRCYLTDTPASIENLRASFGTDSFDKMFAVYRLTRDFIQSRRKDESRLDRKTKVSKRGVLKYLKNVKAYMNETKKMVNKSDQKKKR